MALQPVLGILPKWRPGFGGCHCAGFASGGADLACGKFHRSDSVLRGEARGGGDFLPPLLIFQVEMIARKVGPIVHDREVQGLNWRTARVSEMQTNHRC